MRRVVKFGLLVEGITAVADVSQPGLRPVRAALT